MGLKCPSPRRFWVPVVWLLMPCHRMCSDLFGDPYSVRRNAYARLRAKLGVVPPAEWMTSIDLVAASCIFDLNIVCLDADQWTVYNRLIIQRETVSPTNLGLQWRNARSLDGSGANRRPPNDPLTLHRRTLFAGFLSPAERSSGQAVHIRRPHENCDALQVPTA